MEASEQTQAPASDPFAGNGSGNGQPPEQAPAQPAPPPEQAPAEQPEPEAQLSEQEQALVAKLAGPLGDAVRERVAQEPPEESLTPDQLLDRLTGPLDEPESAQPQQAQQPQAQPQGYDDLDEPDPYGLGQEQDRGTPTPAEIELRQQLDAVVDYLQAREQHELHRDQATREQQILDFADKNPALLQPDVSAGVQARINAVAERAGDRTLLTSPELVEMAFAAEMRTRAQPAEVPADEARNQGAELETNAGAAVSGEPDPEDQWWDSVKNAGGRAFPS